MFLVRMFLVRTWLLALILLAGWSWTGAQSVAPQGQRAAGIADTAHASGTVFELDRAWLVDHHLAQPSPILVRLPDAWEHTAPTRDGAVTYRLVVPDEALAAGQPAVLIRRVGNIFRVMLNGERIAEVGRDRRPLPNHGNVPHLLRLPQAVLVASGNVLEIVVIGEPRREAGLSTVHVGPEHLLDSLYWRAYAWQVLGSWLMAAACLTMSLLAALAAVRTRQAPYAWFAAANFLWAWRVVAPLVSDPPWLPLWQWAFYASYNWFLALIVMYTMMVLGLDRPWLRWTLALYAVATAVAGAFVWVDNLPQLRTIMLLATLALALFASGRIVHAAVTQRSLTAYLLAGSAVISTALGTRDWLVFRVMQEYGAHTWARYAVLLFLLVLGWILIDEFAKSLRSLQSLNAGLQETVSRKEQALQAAFERARAQDRSAAARAERDRILREMHDGLGGRLVSAISLARGLDGPTAEPTDAQQRAKDLNETLDDCLVELRLALDTLELEHQTLAEALAELRYRVDPSLRAAGVRLQWELAEDTHDFSLAAGDTLHVLRIVREALTNIIKHARASTAQLSLQHTPADETPAGVRLVVSDNGSSLDAAPAENAPAVGGSASRSRGLNSMAARAEQLGGRLKAGPADQGWAVTLWLPSTADKTEPSAG